jgi:hypothetical protein
LKKKKKNCGRREKIAQLHKTLNGYFEKKKAGSNLQASDSFPALIQLATPKSTLL